MLIESNLALRFIEGYKAVLLEVHRESGKPAGEDIISTLASARTHLKENPQSLASALVSLAAAGTPAEPDIQRALQSLRIEQWVYLRSTTRYSIFIDKAVENAYAVLGLTNTIAEIVGGSAVTFEAALFPFAGRYVCDGIVESPIHLGPNYKAQFNAALSAIKKRGRFYARCEP